MAVKLEFVGHACFRLWEDNRPSIVMDPYGQTACGLVDAPSAMRRTATSSWSPGRSR